MLWPRTALLYNTAVTNVLLCTHKLVGVYAGKIKIKIKNGSTCCTAELE